MPYKYIGRTTDFKGKTLWEILGNLKNFGVGRIVTRSIYERYPEPSYFKILKVQPLQCPEVQTMDNLRKVRVHIERTFRGVTTPTPVIMLSTTYKSDYRLIPKDEEEKFCRKVNRKKDVPIFPKKMDFPPVLKEVILREKKANGEDIKEDIKLDIVYKINYEGKYRIAQDGETPTVKVTVDMEELPNVSMYKNIKLST